MLARYALFLLLLLLSPCTLAQGGFFGFGDDYGTGTGDVGGQEAEPRWRFAVGAGIGAGPNFQGSDKYRLRALPFAVASYGRFFIGFGGLGEGVCTIDGEGCPAADCRQRVCQGSGEDAPFWQYFRQRSPGDWVALSLGASATKVRDGDIDGWSWTGHNPELPPLTIADVARFAGVTASPAATPGDAGQPTAAVRTIYPPGMGPSATGDSQGTTVYLAGAAALAVVGGATIVAVRRRARQERAA